MTLQEFVTYISEWTTPLLILGIPIYGMAKGVKIYEVFVEGAKEGFDIAIRIMPFLVAILVAIGIFRDVQAMDLFSNFVRPFTSAIKLPPEILPMALIRPLSGGGATGVMNSIFLQYGPDSYVGILASVLMGSTETTFYVLAVYFGSVNIKKTRHAVLAGLSGDLAGIVASVYVTYAMFKNLYHP